MSKAVKPCSFICYITKIYRSIRIPIILNRIIKIPMDVFGLQKAVQAFLAEFAGVATHLETAKGTAVVVGQGVVDPDGAGLQ